MDYTLTKVAGNIPLTVMELLLLTAQLWKRENLRESFHPPCCTPSRLPSCLSVSVTALCVVCFLFFPPGAAALSEDDTSFHTCMDKVAEFAPSAEDMMSMGQEGASFLFLLLPCFLSSTP